MLSQTARPNCESATMYFEKTVGKARGRQDGCIRLFSLLFEIPRAWKNLAQFLVGLFIMPSGVRCFQARKARSLVAALFFQTRSKRDYSFLMRAKQRTYPMTSTVVANFFIFYTIDTCQLSNSISSVARLRGGMDLQMDNSTSRKQISLLHDMRVQSFNKLYV